MKASDAASVLENLRARLVEQMRNHHPSMGAGGEPMSSAEYWMCEQEIGAIDRALDALRKDAP